MDSVKRYVIKSKELREKELKLKAKEVLLLDAVGTMFANAVGQKIGKHGLLAYLEAQMKPKREMAIDPAKIPTPLSMFGPA